MPRRLIVEADGGSRGNPGPAGYGTVVFTADRATVLAESKQAIGLATNNVAEYRGLIAGLTEAAELGATEVAVSMARRYTSDSAVTSPIDGVVARKLKSVGETVTMMPPACGTRGRTKRPIPTLPCAPATG